MLTWFIDGASFIDVNPFWYYFILYEVETGSIAGFTTVYQAYRSAVKYRAKISQVFIFPTFQRQGLGSKLYEQIYDHYLSDPECFQTVVEDANDEFQLIQDVANCKKLLEIHPELHTTIVKECNCYIHSTEQLIKILHPTVETLKGLAEKLKLNQSVLRLFEILVYSFMESSQTNPTVH